MSSLPALSGFALLVATLLVLTANGAALLAVLAASASARRAVDALIRVDRARHTAAVIFAIAGAVVALVVAGTVEHLSGGITFTAVTATLVTLGVGHAVRAGWGDRQSALPFTPPWRGWRAEMEANATFYQRRGLT